MRGVGWNVVRTLPSARLTVFATGMLETTICLAGVAAVSVKLALIAGSSHIGAKRRASDASNCVTIMRCLPPAPS